MEGKVEQRQGDIRPAHPVRPEADSLPHPFQTDRVLIEDMPPAGALSDS